MTFSPNLFRWFWKPLDGYDRSILEGLWTEKTAPAGDVVIEEGAGSFTLHLIDDGAVEVVRPEASSVPLGRKGPGDFFGEMGFLSPGQASARVVAAVPSRFTCLTHEALARLRNEGSSAAALLTAGICRDLAHRIRSFSAAAATRKEAAPDLRPLLGALLGVDRSGPLFEGEAAAAAQSAAMVSAPDRLVESLDLLQPAAADSAYRMALRNDIAAMARLVPLDLREVPGGQVLFREGDLADGAYLILDGAVRVVVDRGGGPLHVDRTLEAGAVVGLIAFFASGARTATCSTVGPTRLVRFPTLGVRLLLHQAPRGALGVYLLDWFGRQLVADARALNRGLSAALAANRPSSPPRGA